MLRAASIVFATVVAAWMFRYEPISLIGHRNRFTGAVCNPSQAMGIRKPLELQILRAKRFAKAVDDFTRVRIKVYIAELQQKLREIDEQGRHR